MNEYIQKAEESLIHAYNRFQIVLEKGEGTYLYDINGKKYLDFTSGIAVFALGYGNKEYNDALKEQIDKLIHTSNLFYTVPMAEASVKVIKASGMEKVFFTNSGAEAIEGAIKIARKYTYLKGQKNRYEIISMEHSFHGRSTGALALTGKKAYREPFEPLIPGVKFANFNDLESVKALVNENTCAIIMEPVQGEGGIFPATLEFVQGIRKLCDENDIILIFDEIQCGMGRCGSMYTFQDFGVEPDVLTTAKALGCGIPVGAFLTNSKVSGVLQAGDHGTTYGGNPLVCAAVSKVFDLFEQERIVEHVKEVTPYLEEKLDSLVEKYEFIKERRGKGFMQGLEFTVPVAEIINKVMDAGVILISAGPNVIRFVPPLIIDKDQIDEMIVILNQTLKLI